MDIDKVLEDTAKDIKNNNVKYLTHEEVFENAKRIIEGKEEV